MKKKIELDKDLIAKRTRRSFIIGGAAALAGLGAWKWLVSRPLDEGTPWPFRKVLGINEGLWRDMFSPHKKSPQVARRQDGTEARLNGSAGLLEEVDEEKWRMKVTTPNEFAQDDVQEFAIGQIKSLPQQEESVVFKCVEGWSENVTYAGARFSDFMKKNDLGYKPQTSLGAAEKIPFEYVGLRSIDGKYYVSLDIESMLHPQTLLCYEMNGEEISAEHGAPLRLIVPVKYGFKSIKQIGSIQFSSSRPPDYWTERGYDWYAGL